MACCVATYINILRHKARQKSRNQIATAVLLEGPAYNTPYAYYSIVDYEQKVGSRLCHTLPLLITIIDYMQT